MTENIESSIESLWLYSRERHICNKSQSSKTSGIIFARDWFLRSHINTLEVTLYKAKKHMICDMEAIC